MEVSRAVIIGNVSIVGEGHKGIYGECGNVSLTNSSFAGRVEIRNFTAKNFSVNVSNIAANAIHVRNTTLHSSAISISQVTFVGDEFDGSPTAVLLSGSNHTNTSFAVFNLSFASRTLRYFTKRRMPLTYGWELVPATNCATGAPTATSKVTTMTTRSPTTTAPAQWCPLVNKSIVIGDGGPTPIGPLDMVRVAEGAFDACIHSYTRLDMRHSFGHGIVYENETITFSPAAGSGGAASSSKVIIADNKINCSALGSESNRLEDTFYSVFFHSPGAYLTFDRNTHSGGHLSLSLYDESMFRFDDSYAHGLTVHHFTKEHCGTFASRSVLGFIDIRINSCAHSIIDISNCTATKASYIDMGTAFNASISIRNDTYLQAQTVLSSSAILERARVEFVKSIYDGLELKLKLRNSAVLVANNSFVGNSSVLLWEDCHQDAVNFTAAGNIINSGEFGVGFMNCTLRRSIHTIEGNTIRNVTHGIYYAESNTVLDLTEEMAGYGSLAGDWVLSRSYGTAGELEDYLRRDRYTHLEFRGTNTIMALKNAIYMRTPRMYFWLGGDDEESNRFAGRTATNDTVASRIVYEGGSIEVDVYFQMTALVIKNDQIDNITVRYMIPSLEGNRVLFQNATVRGDFTLKAVGPYAPTTGAPVDPISDLVVTVINSRILGLGMFGDVTHSDAKHLSGPAAMAPFPPLPLGAAVDPAIKLRKTTLFVTNSVLWRTWHHSLGAIDSLVRVTNSTSYSGFEFSNSTWLDSTLHFSNISFESFPIAYPLCNNFPVIGWKGAWVQHGEYSQVGLRIAGSAHSNTNITIVNSTFRSRKGVQYWGAVHVDASTFGDFSIHRFCNNDLTVHSGNIIVYGDAVRFALGDGGRLTSGVNICNNHMEAKSPDPVAGPFFYSVRFRVENGQFWYDKTNRHLGGNLSVSLFNTHEFEFFDSYADGIEIYHHKPRDCTAAIANSFVGQLDVSFGSCVNPVMSITNSTVIRPGSVDLGMSLNSSVVVTNGTKLLGEMVIRSDLINVSNIVFQRATFGGLAFEGKIIGSSISILDNEFAVASPSDNASPSTSLGNAFVFRNCDHNQLNVFFERNTISGEGNIVQGFINCTLTDVKHYVRGNRMAPDSKFSHGIYYAENNTIVGDSSLLEVGENQLAASTSIVTFLSTGMHFFHFAGNYYQTPTAAFNVELSYPVAIHLAKSSLGRFRVASRPQNESVVFNAWQVSLVDVTVLDAISLEMSSGERTNVTIANVSAKRLTVAFPAARTHMNSSVLAFVESRICHVSISGYAMYRDSSLIFDRHTAIISGEASLTEGIAVRDVGFVDSFITIRGSHFSASAASQPQTITVYPITGWTTRPPNFPAGSSFVSSPYTSWTTPPNTPVYFASTWSVPTTMNAYVINSGSGGASGANAVLPTPTAVLFSGNTFTNDNTLTFIDNVFEITAGHNVIYDSSVVFGALEVRPSPPLPTALPLPTNVTTTKPSIADASNTTDTNGTTTLLPTATKAPKPILRRTIITLTNNSFTAASATFGIHDAVKHVTVAKEAFADFFAFRAEQQEGLPEQAYPIVIYEKSNKANSGIVSFDTASFLEHHKVEFSDSTFDGLRVAYRSPFSTVCNFAFGGSTTAAMAVDFGMCVAPLLNVSQSTLRPSSSTAALTARHAFGDDAMYLLTGVTSRGNIAIQNSVGSGSIVNISGVIFDAFASLSLGTRTPLRPHEQAAIADARAKLAAEGVQMRDFPYAHRNAVVDMRGNSLAEVHIASTYQVGALHTIVENSLVTLRITGNETVSPTFSIIKNTFAHMNAQYGLLIHKTLFTNVTFDVFDCDFSQRKSNELAVPYVEHYAVRCLDSAWTGTGTAVRIFNNDLSQKAGHSLHWGNCQYSLGSSMIVTDNILNTGSINSALHSIFINSPHVYFVFPLTNKLNGGSILLGLYYQTNFTMSGLNAEDVTIYHNTPKETTNTWLGGNSKVRTLNVVLNNTVDSAITIDGSTLSQGGVIRLGSSLGTLISIMNDATLGGSTTIAGEVLTDTHVLVKKSSARSLMIQGRMLNSSVRYHDTALSGDFGVRFSDCVHENTMLEYLNNDYVVTSGQYAFYYSSCTFINTSHIYKKNTAAGGSYGVAYHSTSNYFSEYDSVVRMRDNSWEASVAALDIQPSGFLLDYDSSNRVTNGAVSLRHNYPDHPLQIYHSKTLNVNVWMVQAMPNYTLTVYKTSVVGRLSVRANGVFTNITVLDTNTQSTVINGITPIDRSVILLLSTDGGVGHRHVTITGSYTNSTVVVRGMRNMDAPLGERWGAAVEQGTWRASTFSLENCICMLRSPYADYTASSSGGVLLPSGVQSVQKGCLYFGALVVDDSVLYSTNNNFNRQGVHGIFSSASTMTPSTVFWISQTHFGNTPLTYYYHTYRYTDGNGRIVTDLTKISEDFFSIYYNDFGGMSIHWDGNSNKHTGGKFHCVFNDNYPFYLNGFDGDFLRAWFPAAVNTSVTFLNVRTQDFLMNFDGAVNTSIALKSVVASTLYSPNLYGQSLRFSIGRSVGNHIDLSNFKAYGTVLFEETNCQGNHISLSTADFYGNYVDFILRDVVRGMYLLDKISTSYRFDMSLHGLKMTPITVSNCRLANAVFDGVAGKSIEDMVLSFIKNTMTVVQRVTNTAMTISKLDMRNVTLHIEGNTFVGLRHPMPAWYGTNYYQQGTAPPVVTLFKFASNVFSRNTLHNYVGNNIRSTTGPALVYEGTNTWADDATKIRFVKNTLGATPFAYGEKNWYSCSVNSHYCGPKVTRVITAFVYDSLRIVSANRFGLFYDASNVHLGGYVTLSGYYGTELGVVFNASTFNKLTTLESDQLRPATCSISFTGSTIHNANTKLDCPNGTAIFQSSLFAPIAAEYAYDPSNAPSNTFTGIFGQDNASAQFNASTFKFTAAGSKLVFEGRNDLRFISNRHDSPNTFDVHNNHALSRNNTIFLAGTKDTERVSPMLRFNGRYAEGSQIILTRQTQADIMFSKATITQASIVVNDSSVVSYYHSGCSVSDTRMSVRDTTIDQIHFVGATIVNNSTIEFVGNRARAETQTTAAVFF